MTSSSWLHSQIAKREARLLAEAKAASAAAAKAAAAAKKAGAGVSGGGVVEGGPAAATADGQDVKDVKPAVVATIVQVSTQ